MRTKLRKAERETVQLVDPNDPAAAFTSGPYGHGSRVFARVGYLQHLLHTACGSTLASLLVSSL